jgi:hypothetical protein
MADVRSVTERACFAVIVPVSWYESASAALEASA